MDRKTKKVNSIVLQYKQDFSNMLDKELSSLKKSSEKERQYFMTFKKRYNIKISKFLIDCNSITISNCNC